MCNTLVNFLLLVVFVKHVYVAGCQDKKEVDAGVKRARYGRGEKELLRYHVCPREKICQTPLRFIKNVFFKTKDLRARVYAYTYTYVC